MALGTRGMLIGIAEDLLRTKGYAAFSYADLAKVVGIKKASIHHHFPTKEDLGVTIASESIARLQEKLAHIASQYSDVLSRIEAYFDIFKTSGDKGLLPLCGALAAEMTVLPPRLQEKTQQFFDLQLKWLGKILDEGKSRGEVASNSDSRKMAFLLLSVLEGASFINWVLPENGVIDKKIIRLIISE